VVACIFKPVGNDGAILQFWTPSLTRKEHPGHEITFTINDRTLCCSCESALYGCKNYKPVTSKELCKHCQGWVPRCYSIIARALKEAV